MDNIFNNKEDQNSPRTSESKSKKLKLSLTKLSKQK